MNADLIVVLLLETDLVHKTTVKFWNLYNALPEEIQAIANKQFALLKQNPLHPSLHFRKLPDRGLWEAYVTNQGVAYRAFARPLGQGSYEWFFIGTHREAERFLRSL